MSPAWLLLLASAAPLAQSQSAAPGAGADPLPELLARIDPARLASDVERLVSFHTRHTASRTDSDTIGIGAARRWLRAELEAVSERCGGRLAVGEQRFVAGIPGLGEVEIVNVFGFLPGEGVDPLGRTYVVSGHYDSISGDPRDVEAAAPGADDDASGTAVVLQLARVLAPGHYQANLVFLCVAGEEQGLFGAKHFVADARERGVWIDGMVTNDIVGGVEGGDGRRDERTLRCFSDDDGLNSPHRELSRALVASAARYVPEARVRQVFRNDRFGRGGDHLPFQEQGWPAVRLTEAHEHYGRQHQDVREEDGVLLGDRLEFVSPDYAALVARVNGALLGELALAPPPPSGVRLRAALSYDTDVSWTPAAGPVAAYEVVWRETSAPDWEGALTVDPTPSVLSVRGTERELVRATLPGISADGAFLGVRSVGPLGHRSRVVLPDRP